MKREARAGRMESRRTANAEKSESGNVTSPVAPSVLPAANSHIPASSWHRPPTKSAIPTTMLGVVTPSVCTLTRESIRVVDAKESKPLNKTRHQRKLWMASKDQSEALSITCRSIEAHRGAGLAILRRVVMPPWYNACWAALAPRVYG